MQYDANFVLSIQIIEPYADFLTWLRDHYSYFDWEHLGIAKTPDNYVLIKPNDLYDESKIDNEDGHLYYAHILEVISNWGNDISETQMQKQAEFAEMLMTDLRARGHKVGIDAPDIEAFL